MTDFDRSAQEIATALDSGREDIAAQSLSQFAQSLSREDFRKLVTTVDQKEKDDVGSDLIIKRDTNGTPVSYSVLSKDLHAAARGMAGLMDKGKSADAMEYMSKIAKQIDANNSTDPVKAAEQMRLWSLAVDAYERDGVGCDVTIDLKKRGVDGISWQLQLGKAGNDAGVQAPARPDTVTIPGLARGVEARESSAVTLPANSPVAKMYEQVRPAVIKIEATRPGRVSGTTDNSLGSGFLISEDGLIATNCHTYNGFQNVTVRTGDGTKSYTATVVAEDRVNDVALLKITPAEGEKFTPLQLERDSSGLKMNQRLMAFGHPMGWNKTYLSEGTVVGATTISKVTQPNPAEENPNKRIVVMQAHGEEGASGGPVVNDSGRVCGLAELASDSARGQHIFVTPIEPLNSLITQYRQKQK